MMSLSVQIVRTLCLFLTPSERKCSRLCKADSSFKYDTGLFIQGLLKVGTSHYTLRSELEPVYCSVWRAQLMLPGLVLL